MKYTTNLFPKKEETVIDKITYFALHYLRYILVITQFVTICVFFYRFQADQQIVDLKDTLTQKKAIVDSTQNLLTNVKELDFKIKSIKSLYTSQDTFLAMYSYVFQNLPQDITLDSLTSDSSGLTYKGTALNIETIQTMYEKIQNEKVFASVKLEGITKNDNGFSFTLVLTDYKPQQPNAN